MMRRQSFLPPARLESGFKIYGERGGEGKANVSPPDEEEVLRQAKPDDSPCRRFLILPICQPCILSSRNVGLPNVDGVTCTAAGGEQSKAGTGGFSFPVRTL